MAVIRLVSDEVDEYAARHSTPMPALLQELFETTQERMGRSAVMLSGHVEGTFLQMLATSVGARRILEFGMFTGLSALLMAAALPQDGQLITCEVNPEAVALAKSFFARSP